MASLPVHATVVVSAGAVACLSVNPGISIALAMNGEEVVAARTRPRPVRLQNLNTGGVCGNSRSKQADRGW